MNDIPEDVVNKMMIKCGRRCCICRRFRPTKLQVHHIVERSGGGSNEEDNLIVTCFSCHSDVHSRVPFARRFTVDELKGHRDSLVQRLEQGELPSTDSDDTDEAMERLFQALRSVSPGSKPQLMPEALELLVAATSAVGERAGILTIIDTGQLTCVIRSGGRSDFITSGDRRSEAKYKRALEQLAQARLVEDLPGSQWVGGYDGWIVTYDGYLAADELASMMIKETS
jgi:hypothetical protein